MNSEMASERTQGLMKAGCRTRIKWGAAKKDEN